MSAEAAQPSPVAESPSYFFRRFASERDLQEYRYEAKVGWKRGGIPRDEAARLYHEVEICDAALNLLRNSTITMEQLRETDLQTFNNLKFGIGYLQYSLNHVSSANRYFRDIDSPQTRETAREVVRRHIALLEERYAWLLKETEAAETEPK